jgi:pimeloyl-ACP methyl ester carboxylesterase
MAPHPSRWSAATCGRRIEGVPHRLYFEEAGQIRCVCLHTAGADNRQYRHLLADPEITRRFRVLAFDMPWHGKSTPARRLAGGASTG